jgi:hypothetical protein
MRSPGLLFIVAAAACSTHDSGPAAPPDALPTTELTCSRSVDAFCQTVDPDCLRTLDAIKNDPDWCASSAFMFRCGDYDVVGRLNVDSPETRYYDKSGALVAYVARSVVPRNTSCFAGPTTFAAPQCNDPGQMLPLCAK